MWTPFKRKRFIAQEAKINQAKEQMHQAAARAKDKREHFTQTMERNGVTLRIFRAMGGGNGH